MIALFTITATASEVHYMYVRGTQQEINLFTAARNARSSWTTRWLLSSNDLSIYVRIFIIPPPLIGGALSDAFV